MWSASNGAERAGPGLGAKIRAGTKTVDEAKGGRRMKGKAKEGKVDRV